MATRMQQRRGTASQWTSADPILNAGEIGYETDTNKFKIGDGTNHWSDLNYFADVVELGGSIDDYIPLTQKGAANGVAELDADGKIPSTQIPALVGLDTEITTAVNTAVNNLVDGAPGALDTLNELAAALGDDANYAATITTALGTKQGKVSGITDTVIGYLYGATSNIQDQISAKAPTDSPTFTGTVVLPTGTVTSSMILNGTILTEDLANDAVTTDKIIDGAITSAKITNGTIVEGDLADQAVTSAKIANGTIVNADINASAAIEWTKLAASESVSATELGYLQGVTSGIQSQIGSLQTGVDGKQAIVAGVSDVEIGYLDGVTSSIQTQINAKQDIVSGVSSTEIGYLDGVTSAIQTQLDSKASSTDLSNHSSDTTSVHGIADTSKIVFSDAASTTLDGALVVQGDLTVNGTNFSASATSITIEDNMIQLAHQNAANTVDLGLVVAYNDGTAKHSGLVRDVSDSKWKLFNGVTTEPSTTVDFTQGSLDDLAVNNLTAAGIVFTDGTQTKEGVVSRTPIIQKTASYTLSSLTERDSLIEVSAAGAVTVSIPTDATLNYPIGTSIDILQTGAGQVTIAAVTPATTTVNATPGLKLRTTWSSATLFKRAANTWVVYGDLTA